MYLPATAAATKPTQQRLACTTTGPWGCGLGLKETRTLSLFCLICPSERTTKSLAGDIYAPRVHVAQQRGGAGCRCNGFLANIPLLLYFRTIYTVFLSTVARCPSFSPPSASPGPAVLEGFGSCCLGNEKLDLISLRSRVEGLALASHASVTP